MVPITIPETKSIVGPIDITEEAEKIPDWKRIDQEIEAARARINPTNFNVQK
jgi:hypothetical protein